MEKCGGMAGFRIDSRQVFGVLPGDNVLHMEAAAEPLLRQVEYLPAIAGALPDLVRQLTHAGGCRV